LKDEESLFAEVLRRGSPAERAAALDRVCAGDVILRRRIESLVAAHDKASGILDLTPPGIAVFGAERVTAAEPVGTSIGPYKLLELIGEGGMGAVYMAEQERPVRRKVALKFIKPGMDTKQAIARFEAERQALALMDHPNIAKVLDAGSTEGGRLYFVMELVKGVPITDYCDANKLTLRGRLELFIQVCQAVQHAHQKGIIHRDLKPTNVLVTLHDGTPVPKVIDFGIAKATSGDRLTERTLFTNYAQLVGTPLYMSPEQAELSGLDVDTRSDVYSLGVLLYELLTGTTPFDRKRLGEVAHDEIRRIIREEEPPKPSTLLSTLGEALTAVSNSRGTEPKKLGQLVRGELDWIVMKALEKERKRRYDSVSSLAVDLRRHLDGEAVGAHPPSASYRMRKLARRHRSLLAGSAVVAAVLIVTSAVSVRLAVRASRAEARAEREARQAMADADVARAVSSFLTHDLLALADPINEPDRELKLRTVLDRAAEKVGGRFASQPVVEASVREVLGDAYEGLGEYERAAEHLGRAAELRGRLSPGHPDVLASQSRHALALMESGGRPMAEAVLRRIFEARRKAHGDDDTATMAALGDLAIAVGEAGHFGEAASMHERALAHHRKSLAPDDGRALKEMENLAVIYTHLNRCKEAEALLLEALEGRRRKNGEDHPCTTSVCLNLGGVYLDQGRYPEAEALFRELFKTHRRRVGNDHPLTLKTIGNLGFALLKQGKHQEAERLLREQLDLCRRALPPDHPDTLVAMTNLAAIDEAAGRLDEAERGLRDVLAAQARALPPDHPDTVDTLSWIGDLLVKQSKWTEGLDALRRVLAARRSALGEGNPKTLQAAKRFERARAMAGQEGRQASTNPASGVGGVGHDTAH
jgi:serine/threonine protein kinase/tetratricopeptide (TPR) repeat protein